MSYRLSKSYLNADFCEADRSLTCSTDNRNVAQPSDSEIYENDTDDEDENHSNSDDISKELEQGTGLNLNQKIKLRCIATLNHYQS